MTSLKKQIMEMQEEWMAKIPSETMDVIVRTSRELIDSGIDNNALNVGDQFPDFMLLDATGKNVSSKELLTQGMLVVNFYRGAWCPYCNAELRALEGVLGDIHKFGAKLVAISPNKPDTSLTLAEKHKLNYRILSDTGNVLAEKMGLVFLVDQELRSIYSQFGFDIPEENGDESYRMPVPATYIIDKSGKIVHANVSADFMGRDDPSVIVRALRGFNESTAASI